MTITTLDPRSKEFLDFLTEKKIGLLPKFAADQNTRLFRDFSISLQEFFHKNVTSKEQGEVQILVGNSIIEQNYFNKSVDVFITKRYGFETPKYEVILDNLKNLLGTKQLGFLSINRNISLKILNTYSLPDNSGCVFSFLIKNLDKNTVSFSGLDSTIEKEGIVVNVWVIKFLVFKCPRYKKLILTEYEGGGINYQILSHFLRYTGIIVKPDGSMFFRLLIEDSVFEKELPEDCVKDVMNFLESIYSFEGTRFPIKNLYGYVLGNRSISLDIFGIDSTGFSNLLDSFIFSNKAVKDFASCYNELLPYIKSNYPKLASIKECLRNFKNKVVDNKSSNFASFVNDWKKELETEISKSQIIFEKGEDALSKITPFNYTKYMYRSKVSENLGISLS